MSDYFIPPNAKVYSPRGVKDLFSLAIKEEAGDIEKVLKNKHRHKILIELYYASFLALALNKWQQRKFYLYPADNPSGAGPPDVLFNDQTTKEAFPVEIMELFYFGQSSFDGDYKKAAQKIWDTKGIIQFPQCHLLVVSRVTEAKFNISSLAKELQNYNWKFERIWFAIYTSSTSTWRFFDVFPVAQYNDTANISFSIEDKNDMMFYY